MGLISEKKRKLCKQKQPPVVTGQQAIFYNVFILCLLLRIIRSSDQGVQFMNFPSQMFFNDINHGYRVATLKKNCDSYRSLWLWLLIAIMERFAEPCALQLHCTSLIYVHSKSKVTEKIFNLLEWLQNMQNCKSLFK